MMGMWVRIPNAFYLFEEIQKYFKHENNTDEYKVLRTALEKLNEDPNISAETKTRIRRILKKQMSSLHVCCAVHMHTLLISMSLHSGTMNIWLHVYVLAIR
jgi:hypothetical protein